MDTEIQRQRRRDDKRLTEGRMPEASSYLWCLQFTVANQHRMAVRRAVEWIGMSKAQLVFLDMKYQTCFLHIESDQGFYSLIALGYSIPVPK